ncbi:hypothetical protein Aperf_G00000105929 [Anoplocephala perfoliata]
MFYWFFILFLPVVSAESDIPIDTNLHHLKSLKLQYGYPIDAFGGMFPTFAVEAEKDDCDGTITEDWDFDKQDRRCQFVLAIQQAVYGASEFTQAIKKNYDFYNKLGDQISRDPRTMQLWSRGIYRLNKVPIPIYLQNDIYPGRPHSKVRGLITSERLNRIKALLSSCIPRLAARGTARSMRPLACNYADFLKIMYENEIDDENLRIIAPPVDSKTMSALYWLLFCKHAWSKVVRLLDEDGLKFNYHPSCPNPCARYLGNPCLGKAKVVQLSSGQLERTDERQDRNFGAQICRAISDSDENSGYSAFTDQAYECVCKKGYRWSNQTRSCVLVNGCDENSACDNRGTRVCVSSVSTLPNTKALPFICLCHSGYMGTRCEKKRDACIENEDPEQMAGNQACRVFLGNNCEPRIGTNVFTCHCSALFTSDKYTPFPNCFRRKPICSTVICNRGDCVASRDQLNYICVCQMGWRGRHCDIPDIRIWLPWEGWSGCSAAICTGLGWRHRVRHCRVNVSKLEEQGVDKGLCEGEDTQRQLCKATCPAAILPYIVCLKIIVAFCLGCVILVVAVGILYLRVKAEVE